MFKINNLFNLFKDNKKMMYAVNAVILLIILSLVLKLDTSKLVDEKHDMTASGMQIKPESNDNYISTMETKVEKMISLIEGVNSVKVMLYTQNTPKLEPVYDENTSSETNIEIGSDGIKREIKRDTKQTQAVKGNSNQVIERYYQYPEITGVLIVVNYTGSKNINAVLLNSVKTLFNIEVNDIEIVLSNDWFKSYKD